MADISGLAAVFEEHRPHLRAVAYRLLGSAADADDAVQDAWLRLNRTEAGQVDNLGAWLTTVVARVSLNQLRTRRRRQEDPVGASWPENTEAAALAGAQTRPGGAAAPSPPGDPEDEAVLADSVGLALLVVLDTLTPAERLAFVLHDMFALPFDEIGAILGRSAEATRQLASRARRRVRGAPGPENPADRSRQREAAAAYLAAARGGDLRALVAILDADVVLTADAAAMPSGRPAALRGAEQVARGAVAAAALAAESELIVANGSVGILFAPGGRLQVVLALTVGPAGLITAIDVIGDPARLRALRLSVPAEPE